uniref:Uncharacterized protein n=1 Tax=Cacopsylla melanoneura TaxID=428564 RepID=A0A8D8UJ62_9HEMI
MVLTFKHGSSVRCMSQTIITGAYSSGGCCTRKMNCRRKRRRNENITANRTSLPPMPEVYSQWTAPISSNWEVMTRAFWSGEARTLSFRSRFGSVEAALNGCLALELVTYTVALCRTTSASWQTK